MSELTVEQVMELAPVIPVLVVDRVEDALTIARALVAGGLPQRFRDFLPNSGFHTRFKAKGRFESLMASVPIRLAVHDEIGLFGAAAAFREMKK